MSDRVRLAQDLSPLVQESPKRLDRVSRLAASLPGSEILRIAGEIRAIVAAGRPVCDLTVGDFAPRHFPVPAKLAEGLREAIARGETNYPPANGLPDLRRAIRDFYARELGLAYPVESIVVTGGSRPGIYALYRAVVDPGEHVVYPVPSWNNNHYVHLVGAVGVPIVCGREASF